MSDSQHKLFEELLALPALERAQIADELLLSLDKPDKEIDALWKKEAEERLLAYEKGDIDTVSLHDVLAKYAH